MSENLKHMITRVSGGLLLAGVLVGAYFLGAREYNSTRCTDMNVIVQDSLHSRLITTEKVKECLDAGYKDLIGTPLSEIDLHKVEEILKGHNSIQECNAYVDNDGVLQLTVTQMKPSVRFQTADRGFYSDESGNLIPIQPSFIADVPIIDGHIPIDTTCWRIGSPEDTTDSEWARNIAAMADKISSDPLWKNSISQIHCDEKGDLIIVTKAGKEKFIFGQPTRIDEKLKKIKIYYEAVACREDAKRYEVVDLRYNRQIIGRNNE